MRFPAARLIMLAAALLSAVAAQSSAQDGDSAPAPLRLSLVEAVGRALSGSREARLAERDVLVSVEGLSRAEARRLPRVDAGADYTALSEPPSIFIQGRETQIADQGIFRARLTAEQTVYDFGRTASRVSQAEARVDAAGSLAGLTRERLAMETIAAFLSARRAEEIRAVAEESLASAREHRKVAGDQYELGVVARNDVLAADVQVANAEGALISAGNQVELSRSRLALRIGYPGDAEVAPEPGEFPVPAGPPPPLGDSVAAAYEKRIELKAQSASIREGKAAEDAARAEFAPAFFGQGGYSYETNDFNPNRSVFSLIAGARMNLFSGFGDEAARREARLAVERREEALRLLKDEIALTVKAAHLSVSEAEKRKAVAEVAVARAEENLRIQNDRYKEGLSISTEILDAQTLSTRAKVDLRNATFDLHEARYRLLFSRGELLDFIGPLTR